MSLDVNISEPDEFNCDELHETIKLVAGFNNIEDFVYHVDYICGKGNNYIANIFRVSINETENHDKNIGVIIKTLVNKTRQELFHELHRRECEFYKDVVPKYVEIQKVLAENERLVLPDCLYSSIEESNEVMVLEDMVLNGFIVDSKPKHEIQDFEQSSLVLKELAKFHALSFIYDAKENEEFSALKIRFSDMLYQEYFLDKSRLKEYFTESFEMSLNVVTDEEATKTLRKIKPYILEILQQFTKVGKTNVLCHGDCWSNNMLFKYEDNEPRRVCFIDFQAVRYANPITDVMYFIYLSTDSNFRSEHLNDLLKIYYSSLKTFLNLYDIEANSVYTEEDFKGDVDDHLPFGLLIALIELRVVTMSPEHEAILNGSKIVEGMNTDEVPGEKDYFKIRINDVVNEAVINGSLRKLIEKTNSIEL